MSARALTSPELALLRSSTQFSKLYLAVHKPNTIYTALLNGVPTSNDQVYQITFDNGSGTLGNVTAGMTLYVGTSAGAFDLGMCRIRKAPIAGTFYIGLTSEIEWQDNAFLTVVDDFDLWAKHATIADEALSMDVDIAYSDQHTNFSPVPIMGTHAVLWLDGATVDAEFDASDSWVHGSTISGYSWSAPGSSASSGMTSATPTITYNAAGFYRVYLTVTAANGKTTTGVRHVFVYDRDANQPIQVFQLAQCVGDYESGGWMFDMEMQAEAALSDIRDRSLVVLFAEDWYGTTKQSIGPVENRENIVCVGRVVGESIRWDREAGRVHFTVYGAHHWLAKIKAFPVEIYFATNTPDSWSVMPSMTVDRTLTHILYWHSTVVETMDYYRTGDTRLTDEGKTLASTLWGQLQDIALTKIMGSPGVDRFGRLFVSIDPQMVPEASRTWATVMDLQPGDWSEGIDIRRVIVNDVSLITLTSQLCDSSGAITVLYSLSPGHVPRRYGDPEQADRLIAGTQAQSNQMAGLLLGWRTNQFPEIPVSLAMNNRMIDVFPRQFCALDVSAGDTPRGIAYNGNLIPRRVSFYFDVDSGWMHPELVFEAETFEQVNTNGDVPGVDDMSIPPFPAIKFPPLPPFAPLYFGDGGGSSDSGPSTVVVAVKGISISTADGLYYSVNFNAETAGDVAWSSWNGGLNSSERNSIANYGFDLQYASSGSYWLRIGWSGTGNVNGGLFYATALGGMWTKLIDWAWIVATYPTIVGMGGEIVAMGVHPFLSETVYVLVNKYDWPSVTYKGDIYSVSRSGITHVQDLTALGSEMPESTYNRLTFGGNKWSLMAEAFRWAAGWQVKHYRFSSDFSVLEKNTIIDTFGAGLLPYITRAGTSQNFYYWNVWGSRFYFTDDNGDTFTEISTASAGDGIGKNITNSTGQLHVINKTTTGKGKSSDYGYTFVDIANLIPGPASGYFFSFGNNDNQVIAGGASIFYTENFWGGETWQVREGNMPYLLPGGYTIRRVLVPGVNCY